MQDVGALRVTVIHASSPVSLGNAATVRLYLLSANHSSRIVICLNSAAGRAVAARWVHLLSGIVSRQPAHGVLQGVLLAAGCGRGPPPRCLRTCLPALASTALTNWVGAWMTALFLQYVSERGDLRALLGTSSSVLFCVYIA